MKPAIFFDGNNHDEVVNWLYDCPAFALRSYAQAVDPSHIIIETGTGILVRVDPGYWITIRNNELRVSKDDCRPVAEAMCSGSGDCVYPRCQCPREGA